MRRKTTVLKQVARSPGWLHGILALAVAAVAVTFVPMAWLNPWQWFIALTLIALVLVRYTTGFKSWLSQDRREKLSLVIRDNNARANAYLPIEYITNLETCDYHFFNNDHEKEEFLFGDHHRVFRQLGYQGPGLIISYQLPRSSSPNPELRSWKFPAPKAQAFIEAIEPHLVTRRYAPITKASETNP